MPEGAPSSDFKSVYLLVFDGLADWEPAHAVCELRRSGKFKIMTVGFSDQPVTTMGGLKIVPDITLRDVRTQNAALLLLPGGDMWQEESQPEIEALVRHFHQDGVPVAAICGATLEIARCGLSGKVRHTSNALSYLREMVPDYVDHGLYVDELAVSDQGIITASGLGSVEFAREILRSLAVYNQKDLATWYDMFKRGLVPASMA
jgi:putative intracellular protease/amidase